MTHTITGLRIKTRPSTSIPTKKRSPCLRGVGRMHLLAPLTATNAPEAGKTRKNKNRIMNPFKRLLRAFTPEASTSTASPETTDRLTGSCKAHGAAPLPESIRREHEASEHGPSRCCCHSDTQKIPTLG